MASEFQHQKPVKLENIWHPGPEYLKFSQYSMWSASLFLLSQGELLLTIHGDIEVTTCRIAGWIHSHVNHRVCAVHELIPWYIIGRDTD